MFKRHARDVRILPLTHGRRDGKATGGGRGSGDSYVGCGGEEEGDRE